MNLTERKIWLGLLFPLESRQAEPTGKAVTDVLKWLPWTARSSITFDRRGEFSDHESRGGKRAAQPRGPYAFADTHRMLYQRIGTFVTLPIASLDRLALQKKLDDIGRSSLALESGKG